jgi:hypothetical protein
MKGVSVGVTARHAGRLVAHDLGALHHTIASKIREATSEYDTYLIRSLMSPPKARSSCCTPRRCLAILTTDTRWATLPFETCQAPCGVVMYGTANCSGERPTCEAGLRHDVVGFRCSK